MPTTVNADIIINKGGVLYRTYSFKPSKQTQLANLATDVAALQSAQQSDNNASRLTALETAINGNGNSVVGIETRLTAQENAWSTFFNDETDNSKIDTLKEVLAEISTNGSNISSILSNKLNISDVIDTVPEQAAARVGKAASVTLAQNIIDSVNALDTKVDSLIQVVNAIPEQTEAGVTYILVDDETPASNS